MLIRQAEGLAGSADPEGQHADNQDRMLIRQAEGLAGSAGPGGQHADNQDRMLIRQAEGLAGSAGPEGQHADNQNEDAKGGTRCGERWRAENAKGRRANEK